MGVEGVSERSGALSFFAHDIITTLLIARRYVVKGRVQGVGFRFFAEDAARREAVRGYVRNQHDGSVEAVAEGDLDAVLRFERALRRGPAGARIDEVETTEIVAANRFVRFSVTG